jgi:hypothetical protein
MNGNDKNKVSVHNLDARLSSIPTLSIIMEVIPLQPLLQTDYHEPPQDAKLSRNGPSTPTLEPP